MTARISRRVAEKFWEEGREKAEAAGGIHLGKYQSVFYDSYMYSDS
jgi:hypothetical protein